MFDYLGVLLSIVLGLALTHVLFGVAHIIQMRRSIRAYWVQLVWAMNVLMYVLAVWWGMSWWRHLPVWRFEEFLFLIGYAIVVFMFAAVLFPVRFGEGFDCEAYYFANRRWFFGLLALALLLDIPETLAKQTAGLRAVPVQYRIFIPFALALAGTGFLSGNRRVHAVICVAFLLALLSYETLTSLDRILASA
jgi:hypothetical protein